MLAPLLIMLREGIEAALIVTIIAAYLKQTGRGSLVPKLWIGVGSAAAVCVAAGLAVNAFNQQLPQDRQELFEAIVGFFAVGVLTWMVFWMRRASRSIKGELQRKVDAAVDSPGKGAAWGLIAMAFFAVLREGLEAVLFLLAAFQQGGAAAFAGATIGVLIAGGLGWGLYSGGLRLDLRRFFTVTAAVVILFAAGLLAGSVHKLWEAGIWNLGLDQAWDMSVVASNKSVLGSVLAGLFGYDANPTVGEVAVYWLYLLPTGLLFFLGGRSRTPAGQATGTDGTLADDASGGDRAVDAEDTRARQAGAGPAHTSTLGPPVSGPSVAGSSTSVQSVSASSPTPSLARTAPTA